MDNDFLDMMPKIQAIKAKLNKGNHIKLKRLCAAKEITRRVKRQPTHWKKSFGNYVSNKILIFKMHKELI